MTKPRLSLAFFQEAACKDQIKAAVEAGVPALGLLDKLIKERFGKLTKGQMRAAGRLLRRVAESLGHRLLRDNVPFKLPQCQFRSGAIYV